MNLLDRWVISGFKWLGLYQGNENSVDYLVNSGFFTIALINVLTYLLMFCWR